MRNLTHMETPGLAGSYAAFYTPEALGPHPTPVLAILPRGRQARNP